MKSLILIFLISFSSLWTSSISAAENLPPHVNKLITAKCTACHNQEEAAGHLDLTHLAYKPSEDVNFARWVKIFDRVEQGEMPPDEKLPTEESKQFLLSLQQTLTQDDLKNIADKGRSVIRRMNRLEYENTLRDLMGAPWLQVKDMLPEDGEAFRFNKVGTALDVSYVQVTRTMQAANDVLYQLVENESSKPVTSTVRYYARDQKKFAGRIRYSQFNRSPERATFPIIGFEADLRVLQDESAPVTVGDKDPEKRELEAMGVVASSYEPIEVGFDKFQAPYSGKYKLRFNSFTFWAGPESEKKWWKPSREIISQGHRHEPVSIYALATPRQLRKIGEFDVTPEPAIHEIEVYLVQGESIQPDAVRLFRSRPPGSWHNPLADKTGMPGVAFRWMEVEGPLLNEWPSTGHDLLFSKMKTSKNNKNGKLERITTGTPEQAHELIRHFAETCSPGHASPADLKLFYDLFEQATSKGQNFQEALLSTYTAILCSPSFLYIQEKSGKLDSHELATRLALFLWNSKPDQHLYHIAQEQDLTQPANYKKLLPQLLEDQRTARFVSSFLDYWLDLRKINDTSPDAELYPDYYLDDALVEAAHRETQLFFTELIKHDLPARNLIASDFVIINERLATHYEIPGIAGVEFRKVTLPADSPRGGLLTQASVLKVTANGTTTSPVLRGVWMMERILGLPPPPPPPSVPAVEPDTRGAKTIREQLEKHRTIESCNLCHQKIDPVGFALESFDVLGGYRQQYRAICEKDDQPAIGYGKNGQPFNFHSPLTVDCSGELPDGQKFKDIFELKKCLLKDERQIARNLVKQLIIYATGSPVRFSDRTEIEAILDRAAPSQYGVRTLILEVANSRLFTHK